MAAHLATGSAPTRRGTEGNGGIPSLLFPCAAGGRAQAPAPNGGSAQAAR